MKSLLPLLLLFIIIISIPATIDTRIDLLYVIVFKGLLILGSIVMVLWGRKSTPTDKYDSVSTLFDEQLAKKRKKVAPEPNIKKSNDIPKGFSINCNNIFKKYEFNYDPDKVVKDIAKKIIAIYRDTTPSIILELSNVAKGLTSNLLQFEPVPFVTTVKGEDRTITPRVKEMENKLPEVQRILGQKRINFLPLVPGTTNIGYTIPSKVQNVAGLMNAFNEQSFTKLLNERNKFGQLLSLPLAIGYQTNGKLLSLDMVKAPHIILGGETGSGKSSALLSYICALTATHTADTLQLDIIDVSRADFSICQDLPHLNNSIIHTTAEIIDTLDAWLDEMERRNRILENKHVRNITEHNKKVPSGDFLPYKVLMFDEIADVLMQSKSRKNSVYHDIVSKFTRIAQSGRKAGLHLLLCTQRPSADVIPALWLANIPTRIAFRVQNSINSKIILGDGNTDAQSLQGNGEGMLRHVDYDVIQRFQGIYVSHKEMEKYVKAWKKQKREFNV